MPDTPAMCVYCRARPIDPTWRPFCSKRCKMLDLARWADGAYRVAGDRASEPETAEGDKSDV
jgi:endogenous inhibitor of DNA gyrase (YacG/DUF329 family)